MRVESDGTRVTGHEGTRVLNGKEGTGRRGRGNGGGRRRGALAVLAAIALAGCGGGESGDGDVNGAGNGSGNGSGGDGSGIGPTAGEGREESGDAPAGAMEDAPGSSVAPGSPADAPLSTEAARAFAVDVAELNDALQFLAVALPPELAATDVDCGGTREIAVTDGTRRVTFTDCALAENESVLLDGTAAVAEVDAEPGVRRLALDALTVRSGSRSVAASGTLRLVTAGDALDVTVDGDALDIDDSQGALRVTALAASLPSTGRTGEASVAYAVESTRAGASAAVSTDGTLAFDGTLGCPEGGTLRVSVDDEGELSMIGAPGGNVGLGGDFGDDTLACSEIGRLVPAPSGFLPPPAPGN